MRRFELEVEGENYEIEIVGDTVTVNGHPFVVAVEGNTVLVDGTAHVVELKDGRALVDGIAYAFTVGRGLRERPVEKKAIARPPVKVAEGVGVVKAIMPGRIIRVLVREGDEVRDGDVVCVLEAMKMENELRAPRAGLVREVRVSPGMDVEAGEVLVVVG